MWANVQRDGRPAKYRVPCSNASFISSKPRAAHFTPAF